MFGIGNLTNEEIQKSILDYVRVIETFYTDRLNYTAQKTRRVMQQEKVKRGKQGMSADKRTELEEILGDSIEKTRIQIFRRKMRQERNSKTPFLSNKVSEMASAEPEVDEQGLENTLQLLREFVHGRIKYKQFNDSDKFNLVEMFVTHPTSLLKFYEMIFPQ